MRIGPIYVGQNSRSLPLHRRLAFVEALDHEFIGLKLSNP
jgi:hypothetical protein